MKAASRTRGITLLIVSALAAGFADKSAAADTAPAPEAFVNALEGTFGVHPGARRSHAKGICAEGYFVGSAAGAGLSRSALFSGERIPVVARFSVGGGNPKASDKGKTVRGLALQFSLPGNQRMLMANISAPVFFVAKPEHFIGFLEARKPDPATGRPDPARVKDFNDKHPDTRAQIDYLAAAPVPASYATVNYWGVNAFKFVNAKNQSQYVRWVFEPAAGTMGLTDEQLKTMPDDFLADELRERARRGPIEFDFAVQLAQSDDDTTNPTLQWPVTREKRIVGKLTLTKVESGAGGACQDIAFDPLVLPPGIEPSADPVLNVRSAPYAVSLARRLGGS